MDSNITLQTKQMIDSLKAVCTNFGLGNASSEYKIITEVFLYKFLNDKFLFEAKRVEPALAKLSPADAEKQLAQMTDDDYELFLLGFDPDTAKLKQTHFISYLFNRKNEENFHMLFDDTLLDIATYNIDIFSVRTGGQSKMRLFSGISQHVIEAEKKDDFCRAIIDKIAECSFDSVFEQKYDFFAQIFEYLIKDYNKDFGKYAEYYTPHSIASIIAKIMVPNGAKNVTVYDPAAGSGTLVLALAHEIGESNCTIYTQDISQKSNEFLRLNLILNNLVHSLPNVVHDDTLLRPYHKNAKGDGLATFDYIVSNPPFNMDFSDSRDTLAGDNHKKRFFAGVPSIPKKDIQQISQVIEKIGYMQAKQNDLTIFVEKDPAAIAVAEGEFIPESLSYRQISYTHYPMTGNPAEQKTTWLDLANLLEPQRTILERIDKTFSSDLFYTFNNFHIRHNNIDQLGTKYKKPVGDLSDEQLEYWYDEVYQMCLLAFMRLEHIDRKKKFDSLKSQIEGT